MLSQDGTRTVFLRLHRNAQGQTLEILVSHILMVPSTLPHLLMKQAIEEGFILDVLANYVTYKMCYQIASNTPENPTPT